MYLVFLMMTAVLVAPDDPLPSPTLDRLAAEAATMQAEKPDRWASYRDQSDRVFAENAKLVAGWRNRSSPPPPNLKPLGLPLAFLVDVARRVAEAPETGKVMDQGMMPGRPGPAFSGKNFPTLNAYLDAIAHHPDDRRIALLLEFRDAMERRTPGIGRSFHWPRRIAEAATREWALEQIRNLVRETSKPDQNDTDANLPFCLANRFAGNLPPDVATLAYDYFRDQYPLGPRNGLGDRVWDILLRLDPLRARREILPYFYGPTGRGFRYNIYVPMLLQKHAGPSPELAKEVRKWLERTDLDPGHRRDLRVILLRADPAHEVKPALEHIDRLIAEQVRKGEPVPFSSDVSYLVPALGTVGIREADDAQAHYVFERAIPDIIRIQAMESLARRHDSRTQALVARWLAEESPHMQAYLRKKASQDWGDEGRLILQRIDAPR